MAMLHPNTEQVHAIQRRLEKPISLNIKEDSSSTPVGSSSSSNNNITPQTIENVLDSIPQNYQRKAKFLLSKLSAQDSFNVNPQLEISINDDLIPVSNIIDLT